MQFLTLYTPSTRGEPTPEHMQKMGELITRMMATGELLNTAPLGMRATGGMRITLQDGDFQALDNPPGDSVLLGASGFALLQADTRAQMLKGMREFLETAGDGSVEVIQLAMDLPANLPTGPRIDPMGAMAGVIPYLTVDGAREVSAFYQKAFGAEELAAMPAEDGKRLMHCHLKINGGSVMLGDNFPEFGFGPINRSESYTLQLVVADGQAWWDRAIAAGCEVIMPFAVAPWGDTYGQLKDPFGIRWAVNQPA